MTKLTLHGDSARHALTSIPWPAEREDAPAARGVASQAIPLFEPHTRPRLRRYLLLTHADEGLPQTLEVGSGETAPDSNRQFSNVEIVTLRESLDKNYTYRECEARITVAGREIGFRLGLQPNDDIGQSWWQWCRAERIWSGSVAEAWRIGGHLVPYTIDTPGKWERPELMDLGDLLNRYCGDILQGDVYLIVWRSRLLQLTCHFKSAYFHTFPKPVPAFPIVYVRGADPGALSFPVIMFEQAPPLVQSRDGGTVVQPWQDLRFLASKSRHDELIYLPPAKPDVMPAGVSRTFWFNIASPVDDARVARYTVSPQWYRPCGVIESDAIGPAATMARRNIELIDENTQKGGIDTGRVWRYLRRDLKLNKPQEDGAEWEGNLAQAMFTLAYQRGDSTEGDWELYLHHAYHAADVSVYHGSWMGRLECTAAFSAPLPKFRFGGFLYGYLETGDTYLLELSRSLAGVYMAMESALEPRSAIGRDAYPISCLMALWDHDPQPLYLDFARQTAIRLLSTQNPDGSFSAQAGAGVLTGVSCRTRPGDIHFGSGILSPIALLEWATRDNRWPDDFLPRLRRWADLMLSLQKSDGHWYVEGGSNEPYTLTGSATLWSLIKAGQILNDPSCLEAVRRYLDSMNAKNMVVLGTHSFLSAQYAHVADAILK